MTEEKRKPTGYQGRPWRYSDAKALEKTIGEYFEKCEKRKTLPTMSGIAVALDVDKETVRNYGKDLLFGSVIARAKDMVEQAWEERLADAKGSGVQFNLINNFGWRDRSEREITGAGGEPLVSKIVIEYGDDK